MRHALIFSAAALLCGGIPAAYAQVVTRTAPAAERASAGDIARLREGVVAAINAADAEALSALYAADAVLVPGDGRALRGRAEIAKYYSRAFDEGDRTRTVTINGLTSESGDELGSETGRFEETQMSAKGTLARVSGVYVIIYSRGADRTWRVAIEVRTRGDKEALVDW